MDILVVGGTRFFGIPMIEKILENGHHVTVATRGKAHNPFVGRTNQIIMDRTNPESVKSALQGKYYDVIIDKVAYASNDVKNLLENVDCGRYIQMSSCSVYLQDNSDIKEEEIFSESYNLKWNDRMDDYAEGKRQAERAALEFKNIKDCTFVRYPIVMGPNDYTGRLKFYVEHVINQKSMYIDDLNSSMSFIYESDAGEFLAYLVEHQIEGAINGASDGAITPGQIVELIENKVGKKALLGVGDIAPYNGVVSELTFNTDKAKSIGYKFSNIYDWINDLLDGIIFSEN